MENAFDNYFNYQGNWDNLDEEYTDSGVIGEIRITQYTNGQMMLETFGTKGEYHISSDDPQKIGSEVVKILEK